MRGTSATGTDDAAASPLERMAAENSGKDGTEQR